MAISTEDSIREALVGALRAAATELGFDEPPGNVKDYLLEHERDEHTVEYLTAWVDGERDVRCWTVWVLASDEIKGTGGWIERNYTILVRAYYAIGVEGSGAKLLAAHSRVARNAILSLGSTLGKRVDVLRDGGTFTIEKVSGIEAVGEILVGTMSFTGVRGGPDY